MVAWRGCAVLVVLMLLAGGAALGFHVAETAGPVSIERDGKGIPVEEYGPLQPDDRLSIGESGYAVLTDRDGQAMILAGGSTMVLSSDLTGAAVYRIEEGLARIVATSSAILTVPHALVSATKADLLAYVVKDVASVFVFSGNAVAEDASGRKVSLAAGHRLIATGTLFETGTFDFESLGPIIDQKRALIRHLVLEGAGTRTGGSPSGAGGVAGPVRGADPEPSPPERQEGPAGPTGPDRTGEQPQGEKKPAKGTDQASGGKNAEKGSADAGKDSDDAGGRRGGEQADKGKGDDGPESGKASSSGKSGERDAGLSKDRGRTTGPSSERGRDRDGGFDGGKDSGGGSKGGGKDSGGGSDNGGGKSGGKDGGKGSDKGGGKGSDKGGGKGSDKGGDKGGGKGSDKGGDKGGGNGSDKGGGKGGGRGDGGKGGKR
jgi:hypothetical protein